MMRAEWPYVVTSQVNSPPMGRFAYGSRDGQGPESTYCRGPGNSIVPGSIFGVGRADGDTWCRGHGGTYKGRPMSCEDDWSDRVKGIEPGGLNSRGLARHGGGYFPRGDVRFRQADPNRGFSRITRGGVGIGVANVTGSEVFDESGVAICRGQRSVHQPMSLTMQGLAGGKCRKDLLAPSLIVGSGHSFPRVGANSFDLSPGRECQIHGPVEPRENSSDGLDRGDALSTGKIEDNVESDLDRNRMERCHENNCTASMKAEPKESGSREGMRSIPPPT
ncbi:hypothetical protein R1flu_001740 [Riccia fluitans]|uniref:Uncharacterized protein n=1 Tax=Riccia fluitans TaxID=41844 RepID=A0ABD1Y494_9MARC